MDNLERPSRLPKIRCWLCKFSNQKTCTFTIKVISNYYITFLYLKAAPFYIRKWLFKFERVGGIEYGISNV